MNEMEDTTVLYMEIAKDAIGQEYLDSGADVEAEEETEHYATMTLSAKEYYSIDELLLSMIKPCDVFIDAGESSTMEARRVQKAKEMTIAFAKNHPETKTACDKMIKMFDIALKYNRDIDFA
ncbi:hypothetical protein [Hallerella succinigenes]|uniref:Uncharacterized protein n=1 Tax=Hallerella succinigenes TaxID=1896222 RepID=A0A2M9A832_9BACT|nr:hypothetical protein [Hallerella succinigenes]PJJ41880.1 hypothetical protein BGX16_1885 [Hallerella succinigenes]